MINKITIIIINPYFSARNPLRDNLGINLITHTEVRWLTKKRGVERFTSMSREQLNMIQTELSHNQNHRDSLENIESNYSALRSYVEVLDPIDVSLRTLEVFFK